MNQGAVIFAVFCIFFNHIVKACERVKGGIILDFVTSPSTPQPRTYVNKFSNQARREPWWSCCSSSTRSIWLRRVVVVAPSFARSMLRPWLFFVLRVCCKKVSLALVHTTSSADVGFYQPCNNVLVFPANLVRQSTNSAELSTRLQSQYSESLWYNHSLLLVVWWWDTLKHLQSFHGGGTSGGLMRNHASDGFVEDTRGGSEVEWTTAGWVVSGDLAEVGMILHCKKALSVTAWARLLGISSCFCFRA